MERIDKFRHDLLAIIQNNELTKYEFQSEILDLATEICYRTYKTSEIDSELEKQSIKTMKEIDKLIELRKPF